MPRAKKALINSGDVEAVSRATLPEIDPVFIPGDIEVVSEDRLAFAAREEKFMNEKIEIEIEPGTEPNDPLFVHLGHNGSTQIVMRGQPQVVKRKYLYSALMAKQVKMSCTFAIGRDGNEINKLTPSAATSYRAYLTNDPNPQGGSRWVQRVMAESTGVTA